jgi:membrane protease YdiL (CAAX protease family)
MTWLGRQVRRVSVDPWRSIDRDGRPDDAGGFDLGILVLMVATAVALTVAFYVGGPTYYGRWFPYRADASADAWVLHGNLWWAAITVVSCLGLPPLVFACVPGLRARDLVRAAARFVADPRFWLAVAVATAPGILWHPRIEPIGGARWALWSAAHAAELAALIVLMFGYGVAILRPRFGAQAVFAMLIPFTMFHYGRAHGELLGAAAALVVLCAGDLRRPLGGGEPGPAVDRRVIAVLLAVAISLTAQEYLGDRDLYARIWPNTLAHRHYWQLGGFAWWAGWRVLGYVVLPALLLLCIPGVRIRDQHLSLRGFFKHLWVYVVLFALVFPAVVLASRTAAFEHTYPFYKWANRSRTDLWSWEAMYVAQFLSLEFFFRGVMLQSLRKLVGSNAIFFMIVPYCMIHYGKPMPETLGAIGAGLILGTLAMRTRSIWGGVMIHVGVAVSMDVLALGHCPPPGVGRCGGAV